MKSISITTIVGVAVTAIVGIIYFTNFENTNLSKLSNALLQKSIVLVDFDLLNLFVRNPSLFLCTFRYPNSSICSLSIIVLINRHKTSIKENLTL